MKVWIALLLCLAGCATQRPAMVERTVYHTDTIIRIVTEPVSVDTSFRFERGLVVPETLTVEKDRLVVRVVREVDTLRLFAECTPDTIEKEVPRVRIVERTIEQPKSKDRSTFWWPFGLGLGAAIGGGLLLKKLLA